MGVPKDYAGKKYGMLTPICRLEKSENGYYIWLCKCDCGNEVERTVDVFTRGKSSCGCKQKNILNEMSKGNITHNMTHTRLYRIYKGMIGRCYYPCSQRYNAYGGRGIEVCKEWRENKTKFFEWAMKNGYREDLTIERIDVNGNYCPENCKWIPMKEQYKNKQSNANKLPTPYQPKGEA